MTATAATPTTTAPVAPRRPRVHGIPLGYFLVELRRPFRRTNILFNLALPSVLYLALFRTGPHGVMLPHGNFAMWMMLGIAVYGAAATSTSAAASISLEKSSGWMRTMRLTPLSTVAYILTKVFVAMAVSTLPILVVGTLGALTGAHAPVHVWVYGLAAAWAGSAVFSALGIAIGLSLRPDVVMHVPGLVLTGLAFVGDLFIPLSGTMLSIGRYTPMYGVATIARYALNDGMSFSGDHASLTWAFINTGCWFAGFVFWATRRFAKSTARI